MEKSKVLPERRDEEITSMKVNVWFLRFLNKFRTGRESWQDIALRLINSKRLDSKDSETLRREIKNFEKFL